MTWRILTPILMGERKRKESWQNVGRLSYDSSLRMVLQARDTPPILVLSPLPSTSKDASAHGVDTAVSDNIYDQPQYFRFPAYDYWVCVRPTLVAVSCNSPVFRALLKLHERDIF